MAWSAILLKNSNVKLNYDVLASFKKLTPRVSKEMKYGRSVNPIATGEGRFSSPITNGTPNDFHLPASLI